MVRFPNVLLGLILAAGVAIASCNGSEPTNVAEPPASESVEETNDGGNAEAGSGADTTSQTDKGPVSAQADGVDGVSDQEMIAVSIYVMDDSCSNFEPESVEVPADEAMTETVGEFLERHRFEAFKLSGYRVNVENNKATVDLRLAADSERQFLSLSSCEQQGLFGGLEETLIQNSDWKVDQVEFTNRGKEIVL